MTNITFLKDKMWEAAQKSDKKQFDDCCDKLIEKVYSDWWRIGWSICPKDIDDLLKLIDKTAKEAHKSWQKAVKNGDAPDEDVSPGEGFLRCAILIRDLKDSQSKKLGIENDLSSRSYECASMMY